LVYNIIKQIKKSEVDKNKKIMKKSHNLLTENEQKRLYLVHHMHHVKSGKIAQHELHHCFLFSEKNMRGNKYALRHLLDGEKLHHVLDKKFSGKLYDHLNRAFKIIPVKIKNKEFSVIK